MSSQPICNMICTITIFNYLPIVISIDTCGIFISISKDWYFKPEKPDTPSLVSPSVQEFQKCAIDPSKYKLLGTSKTKKGPRTPEVRRLQKNQTTQKPKDWKNQKYKTESSKTKRPKIPKLKTQKLKSQKVKTQKLQTKKLRTQILKTQAPLPHPTTRPFTLHTCRKLAGPGAQVTRPQQF